MVRNLTQQQLADRSGVGRVSIARIERGAIPRVTTASQLARALDVAVEDVWTDTGEPSPKLLAAERSRRR